MSTHPHADINRQLLMAHLGQCPRTTKELAEVTGIDYGRVAYLIQTLADWGRVVSDPPGRFAARVWRLPDGAAMAAPNGDDEERNYRVKSTPMDNGRRLVSFGDAWRPGHGLRTDTRAANACSSLISGGAP